MVGSNNLKLRSVVVQSEVNENIMNERIYLRNLCLQNGTQTFIGFCKNNGTIHQSKNFFIETSGHMTRI